MIPAPRASGTSSEERVHAPTDRGPASGLPPSSLPSVTSLPVWHLPLLVPQTVIPFAPQVQPLPALSPDTQAESHVFGSDMPLNVEIRPSTELSNLSRGLQDIFHRPDLSRLVSAQLVAAIQRGPTDKSLDLTLNPAELGRVRISLTPGDAGIVVTIVAERPETLDLMRRHVDTLAQDFLGLGYGRAEFNFGQTPQRSGQGGGNGTAMAGGDNVTALQAGERAAPIIAPIVTDRVDIRL